MFDFFGIDIFGLASIAVKFSLYISVLMSVGILICMLAFDPLLVALQSKLKRSVILLSVLALISSLVSFSLRGAALTGDLSGMLDAEMLGILWQTSVGGLLILAAVNKLRFIPAMQTGDKTAALRLVKFIKFEWLAVSIILFLTAIFTSVLTLPD